MRLSELAERLGKSSPNVLKKANSLGIKGITEKDENGHRIKCYTEEEAVKIRAGYMERREVISEGKISFAKVVKEMPIHVKTLNCYLEKLRQKKEYENIKGKRTRVISKNLLPEIERMKKESLADRVKRLVTKRKTRRTYYRISVRAYDGLWYVKEAGLEKKTALKRAKIYCKEGRVIIRSCRGKKWS